jgi:hypothetical protein
LLKYLVVNFADFGEISGGICGVQHSEGGERAGRLILGKAQLTNKLEATITSHLHAPSPSITDQNTFET